MGTLHHHPKILHHFPPENLSFPSKIFFSKTHRDAPRQVRGGQQAAEWSFPHQDGGQVALSAARNDRNENGGLKGGSSMKTDWLITMVKKI